MPRPRRVGTRSYRSFWLEVRDDGATGWMVDIYPRGGDAVQERVTLRNAVPNGLDILLDEARLQVDRMLDGPAWARSP